MAVLAPVLRALTCWTALPVVAPLLALQILRVQGQPMILAAKLRYFTTPEFGGLHAAPQAQ